MKQLPTIAGRAAAALCLRMLLVFTMLTSLSTSAWAQPVLRAEKNVGLAVDADGDGRVSPGDTLSYSVRVQNAGDAHANDVVLTDPIPFATELVPGSIFISSGTLLSEDPLIVDLGQLEGNLTSVSVGFRVEIDDPVPAGTSAISNQGIVSSLELPDVVTDDPSTPEANDATVAELPAVPSIVDVPALDPVAIAAMIALLAAVGVRQLWSE